MRLSRRLAVASGLLGLAKLSAAPPDATPNSEIPVLTTNSRGLALPKHATLAAEKAIERGLVALTKLQGADGLWSLNGDGTAYPTAMSGLALMALAAHGNTPTRGAYAPVMRRGATSLTRFFTPNGLITGPNEDNGMPMHGHGFALLAMATVYPSLVDPKLRQQVEVGIEKAIELTAKAQSEAGGWTYMPGSGDEGSVTVTQVQALRACANAGFSVPAETMSKAVRYLERCATPEGGISYSLASGGSARIPISAAAIATLYNAGEFDSPLALRCRDFVWRFMQAKPKEWSHGTGHDYYTHLYASQAFYMAGDSYWNSYFPPIRDQLIAQQAADGSWDGDRIGPTYGTAIALIILQLPYKFLPVYQR